MQTVTLNTSTPVKTHPLPTPKETVWEGKEVELLSSDSSCLTQKGMRFSDRVAPTLTSSSDSLNVKVICYEVTLEEPEWRFADPAPYIPKNYDENLTVEELLHKTGYKFETFDDSDIIQCKKVKDRVVGWWKSGVKWVDKHKKEILFGVAILGTATGIGVGVALLASSAAAEAAVATGAAVGAAVAGGSGSKKKEEEDDKPQVSKETSSASPPPPPVDLQPPKNDKPQPPKETVSTPPPFIPVTNFSTPTYNKSQPTEGLSPSAHSPPSTGPTQSLPFLSLLHSQAKIYSDYLIQHAINPLIPLPSLSELPAPTEKPEEHFYSSMFQTIQKGFAFIGANVIDNPDLFQPDSPGDPLKEHNISSSASQARSTPPLFSIAPLKSVYHDCLNLLVNYGTGQLPHLLADQRSTCFIIEGAKSKSTLVFTGNGMLNRLKDAYNHAKYLRSFTSLQIEGIYNHSNGVLIDLAEIIFLNLAGYSPITEGYIMKKIIDFAEINKDNPHAKCLLECHSQFAIHTRNALEKLPQDMRDRVIVVNIAGARVIPKRLCFQSFNYVSERDIVPLGQFAYKGLMLANLSDEEQQEVFNQEKLDAQEIIVLKAHESVTGFDFDHGVDSLTYADKVRKHLEDYEARKGQY